MKLTALDVHLKLKQRLRKREPTLGLFIKTPAAQIVESVAGAGLDFIALDAEHGPFGAAELDRCIMAGRANDMPVLVRVRTVTPGAILEVLDMGAAGIIAPHIHSAEQAQALVAACRYSGGNRGFTGSSRAAEYGRIDAATFREASDRSVIVIAQIEDAEGVASVEAIAALDELDALLIGRADLAVSLDASDSEEAVAAAVDLVLAAGREQHKTTALFVTDVAEAKQFQQLGASLFIGSTDQLLLHDAVTRMSSDFRARS